MSSLCPKWAPGNVRWLRLTGIPNGSKFDEGTEFAEDGPGNKVLLFRRALLKRNIQVITSSRTGGERLPLWAGSCAGEVKLFRGLMSAEKGISAHKVVRDKAATKEVLQEAGLNVPRSFDVRNGSSSPEELFADIRSEGLLPGVLKPNGGSHGSGVTMGIRTLQDFRIALSAAGASPIFEEEIRGRDYRLVAVGNSLKAATERKPAYVTGDGQSEIHQLVIRKNEERAKNPSTRNHPIRLDEGTDVCLAQQGLSTSSIPENGLEVQLRTVANVGSGGEAYDRTDDVHPDFIRICEKVPQLLGAVEILGIDIIAEDISIAPDRQKWSILELNANPDIDLQHWPWRGEKRDIADELARLYFPESEIGETMEASLLIGGKVRTPALAEWIDNNCLNAGLKVSQSVSESGLKLQLMGTRTSIDWFVEMLVRSRTGAIIRSVKITYC